MFAAHWWDHPDYAVLPPEVHLLAMAHYLNLLDQQRQMVLSHLIFGGKNPHPHYEVGGMPCSISMSDGNAPVNAERLAVVDRSINLTLSVVNYFYLPDLLAIGDIYFKQGYFDGGGLSKERVLAYGEFPDEPYSGIANGDFHAKLLWRCNGVVENFGQGLAAAKFHNVEGADFANPEIIQEMVNHAWYTYPDESKGLHPWDGITQDKFTGPKEGTKTHWTFLDENGKYSWIKTPKWRGKLAEVNPLARYIVTYVKVKQGHIQPTWVEQMVVDQIEQVSKIFNLPPEKWMPTTLGRTITRGLDAQVGAYLSKYFFDKLLANIKAGDTTVANMSMYDPAKWPKEIKGVGISEAPRGALGHWVVIKDSKFANYQAVVPTTWNACPRDAEGKHGAYEAGMIDTRVKIADKPLEVLKTIRSFDPCIACATHLYDKDGKEIVTVRTDTLG
jgi:hydrogenase large subunit